MDEEASNENLLEEFDLYFDDINLRLIISRMVGDAVTKGMVTAVEQVAAERMAAMELERARLDKPYHSTKKMSDKFDLFSNLRHELDIISKSMSKYDGTEEWDSPKRADHFSRKVLKSHVLTSTSSLEGNGSHTYYINALPENFDSSVSNMSRDDMIKYFKSEMTQLKRNHESQVQEMTEDYFSLKREFLNEKEPFKKNKEFDTFKKEICSAISRLKCILMEHEESSSFNKSTEALHLEKHQPPVLLLDKKKEIEGPSVLDSGAEEKSSHYSFTSASMLGLMESLKCAIADVHIEAFFRDEVYKCVLREMAGQIIFDIELFDMESGIMDRTIFREAIHDAEYVIECAMEDAKLESKIMEELCNIIFGESIKDAQKGIDLLMKHLSKNELLMSLLEQKVSKSEKALGLETKEKERLSKELVSASAIIREKNEFGEKIASQLENEREQFRQEIRNLSELVTQQIMQISDKSKELDVQKDELVKAMEKTEFYKAEVENLSLKMDAGMKQSLKANEEREALLALLQEKQKILAFDEAKEMSNRKKLEATIVLVHELLNEVSNFEYKLAGVADVNNFRLQNFSSQLNSLIHETALLRQSEALFKKKFHKCSSDLRLAEAEVDILGDQVDGLIIILKKIYIGLDQYSPVLQYYPRITEIMKVVRKELINQASIEQGKRDK